MGALKRDLIEFAAIYVIVFWLIVADGQLSLGLKAAVFVICFAAIGSAYCAAKAAWRRAAPDTIGS